MGRQHRAAVAANWADLDPWLLDRAKLLAQRLPDEPEPVLSAKWRTLAEWLRHPRPTSEAARSYVKRIVRRLREVGLLVSIGVRPGNGRCAEYLLRTEPPIDPFGGHVEGEDGPQTDVGVAPKNAAVDPQLERDTMPLLVTDVEPQVPTGQLALPGTEERPCLDAQSTTTHCPPSAAEAPTTTGHQHPRTAISSTTLSSRSTRRRMRSRPGARAVSRKRPEENEVGKKAKQPTLFDVPAPVVAAAQAGDGTAHVIVAEWLSRCQVRPPGRIIGQAGKLIKELIAEGIDLYDVRRGMAWWMVSGKHPATIPSYVHQSQTDRAAPASDVAPAVAQRPATTDLRIAQADEAYERFKAQRDLGDIAALFGSRPTKPAIGGRAS